MVRPDRLYVRVTRAGLAGAGPPDYTFKIFAPALGGALGVQIAAASPGSLQHYNGTTVATFHTRDCTCI